jgi:hypothetical protein
VNALGRSSICLSSRWRATINVQPLVRDCGPRHAREGTESEHRRNDSKRASHRPAGHRTPDGDLLGDCHENQEPKHSTQDLAERSLLTLAELRGRPQAQGREAKECDPKRRMKESWYQKALWATHWRCRAAPPRPEQARAGLSGPATPFRTPPRRDSPPKHVPGRHRSCFLSDAVSFLPPPDRLHPTARGDTKRSTHAPHPTGLTARSGENRSS